LNLFLELKLTSIACDQVLLNHGEGGVVFETQTVQRMEGIVLGALQWRMRSITPFSFIPFFVDLFRLKDPAFRQVLKDRASEIILKSQRGITIVNAELTRTL